MYSVWCAVHLSGNNEPLFELYVKDTIQDIRCLKSRCLKVTSLLAERIWCGNELNADATLWRNASYRIAKSVYFSVNCDIV